MGRRNSDPALAAAVLPLEGELRLGDAIRSAAAALEAAGVAFGHGTDNAIDEASWLLLAGLGLSPVRAPDYRRRLDRDARRRCNALLERRIVERIPTAYLTGTAWFAGHAFVCDRRALIPRSPIAELIGDGFRGLLGTGAAGDRAARDGRRRDRDGPRLLDLCTGGGCIAIASALALPAARVDASDISSDALALAAENVARHGVGERVRLLEGSLFEPTAGSYDLILSNPPYVDAAALAAMPAEYHHEPRLGLTAGADGLDLVRAILAGAAERLVEGGTLVVEVGASAAAVRALWPDVPFAWLRFARGGEGVFAIGREALLARRAVFARAARLSDAARGTRGGGRRIGGGRGGGS